MWEGVNTFAAAISNVEFRPVGFRVWQHRWRPGKSLRRILQETFPTGKPPISDGKSTATYGEVEGDMDFRIPRVSRDLSWLMRVSRYFCLTAPVCDGFVSDSDCP